MKIKMEKISKLKEKRKLNVRQHVWVHVSPKNQSNENFCSIAFGGKPNKYLF